MTLDDQWSASLGPDQELSREGNSENEPSIHERLLAEARLIAAPVTHPAELYAGLKDRAIQATTDPLSFGQEMLHGLPVAVGVGLGLALATKQPGRAGQAASWLVKSKGGFAAMTVAGPYAFNAPQFVDTFNDPQNIEAQERLFARGFGASLTDTALFSGLTVATARMSPGALADLKAAGTRLGDSLSARLPQFQGPQLAFAPAGNATIQSADTVFSKHGASDHGSSPSDNSPSAPNQRSGNKQEKVSDQTPEGQPEIRTTSSLSTTAAATEWEGTKLPNSDGTFMQQDAHFTRGDVGVVADGASGYPYGEYASAAVKESFERHWDTYPKAGTLEQLKKWFSDVVTDANNQVSSEVTGAGTTVAAVGFHAQSGKAVITWAGDSRVYKFKDGVLEQVTLDDHKGGYLSNFLGIESVLGQDLKINQLEVTAEPGTRFLLATDGLETLSAAEIGKILGDNKSAKGASDALVQAVKDKPRTTNEVQDNVTALVIDVAGDQQPSRVVQPERLDAAKSDAVQSEPVLSLAGDGPENYMGGIVHNGVRAVRQPDGTIKYEFVGRESDLYKPAEQPVVEPPAPLANPQPSARLAKLTPAEQAAFGEDVIKIVRHDPETAQTVTSLYKPGAQTELLARTVGEVPSTVHGEPWAQYIGEAGAARAQQAGYKTSYRMQNGDPVNTTHLPDGLLAQFEGPIGAAEGRHGAIQYSHRRSGRVEGSTVTDYTIVYPNGLKVFQRGFADEIVGEWPGGGHFVANIETGQTQFFNRGADNMPPDGTKVKLDLNRTETSFDLPDGSQATFSADGVFRFHGPDRGQIRDRHSF